MPVRLGRAVLALLVVLVLSGCALFRPPKATVDVAAVASAFPTIERLGAVVYMLRGGFDNGDPVCEYFEYGRGAFTRLKTAAPIMFCDIERMSVSVRI